MAEPAGPTRELLFSSALKEFAARGYSGASMRRIADGCGLTKPTIYYHFSHKKGLYQTLLNHAYDECYERMRRAVLKSDSWRRQIEHVIEALFSFCREQRDLTRLVFATLFSPPGEAPADLVDPRRRRRNVEMIHRLIRQGVAQGLLTREFSTRELAKGLHGAAIFAMMTQLVEPIEKPARLSAKTATRLFLNGALLKSLSSHE